MDHEVVDVDPVSDVLFITTTDVRTGHKGGVGHFPEVNFEVVEGVPGSGGVVVGFQSPSSLAGYSIECSIQLAPVWPIQGVVVPIVSDGGSPISKVQVMV